MRNHPSWLFVGVAVFLVSGFARPPLTMHGPNGSRHVLINYDDKTPFNKRMPDGDDIWINYIANDDTPRVARLQQDYNHDPHWSVINPNGDNPQVETMYIRATDGSVKGIHVTSGNGFLELGSTTSYGFRIMDPDGSNSNDSPDLWLIDPADGSHYHVSIDTTRTAEEPIYFQVSH
jgi:hypothetical protein